MLRCSKSAIGAKLGVLQARECRPATSIILIIRRQYSGSGGRGACCRYASAARERQPIMYLVRLRHAQSRGVGGRHDGGEMRQRRSDTRTSSPQLQSTKGQGTRIRSSVVERHRVCYPRPRLGPAQPLLLDIESAEDVLAAPPGGSWLRWTIQHLTPRLQHAGKFDDRG